MARVLLGLVALALAAPPLVAQEQPVPVEVQMPLFAKLLDFNRSLPASREEVVILGIAYQRRYPASAATATAVRNAVRQLPLGGRLFRVVLIDMDESESLATEMARQRVRVLYVSPLRAVEISAISKAARPAGILTLTGVPGYVRAGLAIGLDLRDGRPQILVNLEAARAEGADLDARLLQLASIVR